MQSISPKEEGRCPLPLGNDELKKIRQKLQKSNKSRTFADKIGHFCLQTKRNMDLPKIIEENLDKIIEICHKFGVKKIYAFGSVITNRFDPEKSDLDFVVEMEEMPPLIRGEKLIALWEALEDLFYRKVDLITDQSIKNPYLRANINKTKRLIYDREREKIFG